MCVRMCIIFFCSCKEDLILSVVVITFSCWYDETVSSLLFSKEHVEVGKEREGGIIGFLISVTPPDFPDIRDQACTENTKL